MTSSLGALNERVALLAGLPERDIDALMKRITFTPGAPELVRTMRANGARTLLVSGGFTLFADQVAATLGFDFVSANVLEFSGKPGHRVLTGMVILPIRDRTDKLERLTEQAGRYRIPLTETIALQRSGQSAAMMSAVRAPQSKPAMIDFWMFRASIKARMSSATTDGWPLRKVSLERKLVVP